MDRKNETTGGEVVRVDERQAYTQPKLSRFGSIVELTRGGGFTGSDLSPPPRNFG
jgi:hypothetical protein